MRPCPSLAYIQYATLLAPCLDANPEARQRPNNRRQALDARAGLLLRCWLPAACLGHAALGPVARCAAAPRLAGACAGAAGGRQGEAARGGGGRRRPAGV